MAALSTAQHPQPQLIRVEGGGATLRARPAPTVEGSRRLRGRMPLASCSLKHGGQIVQVTHTLARLCGRRLPPARGRGLPPARCRDAQRPPPTAGAKLPPPCRQGRALHPAHTATVAVQRETEGGGAGASGARCSPSIALCNGWPNAHLCSAARAFLDFLPLCPRCATLRLQ